MHVDLQKDGCTKEETVTRPKFYGTGRYNLMVPANFQVSHLPLYDERAVLELTLSLLLNEEVMKPFVVVEKGFHF